MKNTKAHIVIGLGFGDEGKGHCVDFLTNMLGIDPKYRNTIVVRFNGGQQAGHNVIINEKSHIHSNFGAGTLRGYPSYFSKYCTFNPTSLYKEYNVLINKGVTPILTIDPEAILTTPYDIAYNEIIEKRNQHGSCGLGIGATMKRHLETPYKLFAVDLINRQVISLKLANIVKYYIDILIKNKFSIEEVIEFEQIAHKQQDQFLRSIEELFFTKIISVDRINLSKYEYVIFEGAQGIMLDMDHGFFPNVTYSNTTSKNAIKLCNDFGIIDYEIWYVTRCYQTRHGNGPMTSIDAQIELINTESEINKENPWQGKFRIAELDYNLLKYALIVDSIYHDKPTTLIKLNLLVTCLDQRPDFKLGALSNINVNNIYTSRSTNSYDIDKITTDIYLPDSFAAYSIN